MYREYQGETMIKQSIKFILFILITLVFLTMFGLQEFFGYEGYRWYSVKTLPVSYKEGVISQMVEVQHPQRITTTYMKMNNVSIPIQSTTPAYMTYEVVLNGFKSHMEMEQKSWLQLHKGESVRVGYKTSSGGQTFFYTLTSNK